MRSEFDGGPAGAGCSHDNIMGGGNTGPAAARNPVASGSGALATGSWGGTVGGMDVVAAAVAPYASAGPAAQQQSEGMAARSAAVPVGAAAVGGVVRFGRLNLKPQ